MGLRAEQSQRLVALFALGALLLTYPLLALFNVGASVGGFPLLYAYLFGAWGLLIALLALAVRPPRPTEPPPEANPPQPVEREPR
jgi:hypothetical protein